MPDEGGDPDRAGSGPRDSTTRARDSSDPGLMRDQAVAYARDLRAALARTRRASRELARTHVETVAALASAVEVRDTVTGGHVYRVANYGAILAGEMAPELREDPALVYGFLLHDIGKIAIPDAILRKPGPLDAEEERVMREHVGHGIRFVKSVSFLRPALNVITTHHEHFDGSGYPQGIRADEIPLGARMFLVCDAFDAMTHDRPYRRGMAPEQALAELRRHAGNQFDPDVVEAVERVFDRLLDLDEHPPVPSVRIAPAVTDPGRADAAATAAALDAVGQGMVVLDTEGSIVEVNQRFLELLGLTAPPVGMLLGDVVERADAALAAPGDARQQMRQLERDLFSGRRVGRLDGLGGRSLQWTSDVLRGAGDEVIGRVVAIRQVREERTSDAEELLPELRGVLRLLGRPGGAAPRSDAVDRSVERLEGLVRRLERDAAAAVDAGELAPDPQPVSPWFSPPGPRGPRSA